MCLQCTTEAVTYGEVLPGWFLMRATVHDDRWPAGHWGLVQSNDPTLVWASTPTPDPLMNVPEDEWEAWLEAYKGTPAYERTMSREPADFGEALRLPALTGWRLVQAGMSAGYDADVHGDFDQWLFSTLGERVESTTPVHHGDATEDDARPRPRETGGVVRYQVEGDVPATFDPIVGCSMEDGGQAIVAELDETVEEGDGRLFVRLQSWDEGAGRERTDSHPLMRSLMGRRVRVTIRDVGPSAASIRTAEAVDDAPAADGPAAEDAA